MKRHYTESSHNWVDNLEDNLRELSEADKTSNYVEWSTPLQFYKDSVGAPKLTDYVKHTLNFAFKLFQEGKATASSAKDLSLITKSCPDKVCVAIIDYMEKGLSES